MAERLKRYLADTARMPFVLGQSDCGTYLADWVKTVHGIDPAAAVRGTYATDSDLHAMMGPRGLPGFVARLAAAAGLKRSSVLAPGAIGVICSAGGEPVCAIFTGARWVARDNHQVVALHPRRVRVVCCFEV